jgi:2Fe-2S ferredoxin
MPAVTFIEKGGNRRTVDAKLGASLLDVALAHGIDIEGACEGCLSCTTCHVIVEEEFFELLPAATEEEEDMLDLAAGLTATSRLGCQIKVSEEIDGLVVRLPEETNDVR